MRLAAMVVFTVIAIAIGSIGFVVEVPSSTPYSPFNTDPNGYSVMTSLLGAEPLARLGQFRGSIIVPLYHVLSDDEMRWLADYVSAGGRLVIIDEGGYSDVLLNDYLNLSLAVVPVPVLDYVLNYGGNASIPLINASIGDSYLRCYFFEPSSVLFEGTFAAVLANSSPLSFRDVDGSGYFSLGDQFGPFPVVVRADVGVGVVYIITDLDVFSNSFISLGNNSGLLESLVGGEDVGLYLGGLNASFIDYVKVFARLGGGWMGGLAELGSLVVVAVVLFYGRKGGVLA